MWSRDSNLFVLAEEAKACRLYRDFHLPSTECHSYVLLVRARIRNANLWPLNPAYLLQLQLPPFIPASDT